MLFFFLPKSAETPFAVFQQMQAVADVVLDTDKSEYNPIQVRAQVPYWMKKSDSSMANFLQFYYDWLTEGYGYTGINVMDLSNLPDISSTPEFLLPNYINTYAPDIKGIYEIDPSLQPSAENIRRTIVNIKQEIYQRKSNEDAFKSLMASLFGITADTIKISYPKRKLMRLNGGRLEWMSNAEYFGITGEYSNERYTMVGSHLNQGVFPDSGMWQDFSYLLTSEIDDSNPYYEAVVKETLHPAGLLGLYEKIEKYSEGGYAPGPVADYERPMVANYYPYTLGSLDSLPKCSGCTGSLFIPGWTFPTFVYPSWDVEIAASDAEDFGSIRIWDFFILNSVTGESSPNDYIGTVCNFACGTSGSVDYTWYIDKYSVVDDLLTPPPPLDADADGRFGIGGT
jgi:hypothetical protein